MHSNLDPLSFNGEQLLRKISHLSHGLQNMPGFQDSEETGHQLTGVKKGLERTLEDYSYSNRMLQKTMREEEHTMNRKITDIRERYDAQKETLQNELGATGGQGSWLKRNRLEKQIREIDRQLGQEIGDVNLQFERKLEKIRNENTAATGDLAQKMRDAETVYGRHEELVKAVRGEIPPPMPTERAEVQQNLGQLYTLPQKIILKIK